MIKNKHTKTSVLKTLVVTTFVATTIFIFKDAFTSNNGIAGRTVRPVKAPAGMAATTVRL